jgi:hypothetical protein
VATRHAYEHIGVPYPIRNELVEDVEQPKLF